MNPAGERPREGAALMDGPTWAVGLVGVIAFLSLYATQPLLPLFQKAFQASKLEVSLTVSVATLAVALVAPWVGAMADVLGRKRVIVPGIYLLGLTGLLTATSPGLKTLLWWRFLQGFFTPAVFAVTVAYINEEWPGERAGFATSVYVTGTVVGGFLGRFLTSQIAEIWGWRWAFAVLGALTLALAPAVSAGLPLAKKFRRQGGFLDSLRSIPRHLANPALLAVYAVGFCVLFTLVGTFTYVTFHLAAAPYFLGTSLLGSIFFVYLIGAVITPLFGRWASHLPPRWAIAGSLLVSALGVGLTLAPPLGLVIAGVALCASGVFAAQVVANSRIGRVAVGNQASAVGLYVSFYYFGGFVGSVAPGLLWDRGGWPACVAMISSVVAAAALFAVFTWKSKEAPGTVPAEGV